MIDFLPVASIDCATCLMQGGVFYCIHILRSAGLSNETSPSLLSLLPEEIIYRYKYSCLPSPSVSNFRSHNQLSLPVNRHGKTVEIVNMFSTSKRSYRDSFSQRAGKATKRQRSFKDQVRASRIIAAQPSPSQSSPAKSPASSSPSSP